jgi:hypothetical protein
MKPVQHLSLQFRYGCAEGPFPLQPLAKAAHCLAHGGVVHAIDKIAQLGQRQPSMAAAKVQGRVPAPVPVPIFEFLPPLAFELLQRRNDLFPPVHYHFSARFKATSTCCIPLPALK